MGYWPARIDLWQKSAAAFATYPGITQSAADTTRVITGAFAQGFVTPGKTLDRYVEFNTAWTQTSAPIWSGQATAAEGLKQVQQKFLSLIHAK